MTEPTEQTSIVPSGNINVRNTGEPLRFQDVEPLAGFTAESAKAGQRIKVWTRLALTSDAPLFHRLIESLDGIVQHMARKAGTAVNLRRANTALLIVKPDNTAELWVDTAAVAVQCRMKRTATAGSVIWEDDIVDVTGMGFPCVTIGDNDKVLCIFREAWHFGLAFDFNPDGKLDLDWFSTALGTLHRTIRYRHLYEAVNTPAILDSLQAAGWFPFAEIITSEFRSLVRCAEAGFDLAESETKIVAAFDAARVANLLERWSAKPHFTVRIILLKEAIDAFLEQKPASTIKIILTEIEGVLNDAYKAAHNGQGAKLKKLLAFAQTSAEQRAGGPETLFFPVAFGRYLAAHTFANFDPVSRTGTAGSRHAVGHGAATQESYTMPRALQAILTLDQLAFYT